MSITRNLPRSGALHRGHRRHRIAMASAALVAVNLLTAACGNGNVYVKHIHHAPTKGVSQPAQTHAS
jgi:hypothetical protein